MSWVLRLMPNIIQEITDECARVQRLLDELNKSSDRGSALEAMEACSLLQFARQSMALNQYEDMREALDELKAFSIRGKAAEPEP